MNDSIRQAKLDLISDIASFSKDPLKYVIYAFPWGKGELEKFDGPDEWQTEILIKVRDGLLTLEEAIRIAVASGHGVGKSALVAWLILWGLSTFEDTRIIITANTDTQLRTKTWPELSKWYRLAINRDWFVLTATALYSIEPDHEKTWRADIVPWSENNTEAFAGLHNKGKRIILIFDEASAIADKVWEVSEGALTDEATEILWFVFGNPTRNTGRFFDCFNRAKHRWITKQVDSRSSKFTNKIQLKAWVDDYGEDSDFVRVRVRGVFPNTSDRQFIPTSYVTAARGRHLRVEQYNFAPVILSLDNAWTGEDEVVIYKRQGLAATKLMSFRKNDDDMIVAGYLAKLEDEHNADAVFIDIGYGTGVFSAGKSMGRKWVLVSFAGESSDIGYLNKRAEMWALMRDWLKDGGAIPDDEVLAQELCGPEYHVRLDGKIKLESKDDMKKRGLSSPNRADALALTFAFPVKPKNQQNSKNIEFAQHKYKLI